MKPFYHKLFNILIAIVIFQSVLLIVYTPLMKKLYENYDLIITYISMKTDSNSSITSPKFCGYLVRGPWDGRLGSQMFVYASFYGMVQRQKLNGNKTAFIRIDSNPSSLDVYFENLTLPQKSISDVWFIGKNMHTLYERTCCSYTSNNLENLTCDGQNYYIVGFRNGYKYIDHVSEELKREFTFKEHIRRKCHALFNDTLIHDGLDRNTCTVVGAHFRREDFLVGHIINYGHWPAQLDYAKRAVHFYESWYYNIPSNHSYPIMQNASRKGQDCLAFLLFGNDYQWNLNVSRELQLLRPNQTHVIVMDYRKSDAAVDMCALSMCDHNIVSTGTYSWWSGFFSRGMVTYQKQFAKAGSKHYYEFDVKDNFKPEWIPL